MTNNKDNKENKVVKKQNKNLGKTLSLAIIPAVLASAITGYAVQQKGDEWFGDSTTSIKSETDVILEVEGNKLTVSQMKNELYDVYSKSYSNVFINRALIEKRAEDLKIKIEEKEIEEQYNATMSQYSNQAEFEADLLNYYPSVDHYKEEIKIGLLLEKAIYLDNEPTEEQLKEYFEEKKESYNVKEQVEASHILVDTEEEAKEIIKSLKDSKNLAVDFANTAKEKSKEDGANESGGALGSYDEGTMVDEFWVASKSLKVGKMTETPVKTEYGYHVILKTGETKAEEAKFEKMKETVIYDYTQTLKTENANAWLEGLTTKYKVTNNLK